MTQGQSPHLTSHALDVLVCGDTLDDAQRAHVTGCAECAARAAAATRVRRVLTGSGVRPLVPPTRDCREAADVAMLVFAPHGDREAESFLSHAETCDYCGPLVKAALNPATEGEDDVEADADRTLLATLQTGRPEWQRQIASRFAAAHRPARILTGRWVWGAAAGLAAAAAIVLAVRLGVGPSGRPELQELVAAVGAESARPVEGRLTGGFPYAPPPTLLRGPSEPASPRVRIAAAKLEEAVKANETAATRAAVGVAFLATGEVDKAIEALEDAVQQQPGDARYQSDLAAAYLARAKWRDRSEDWPRALAVAERAIKADPALVEPYFNRALALEGLHLDAQAAEAWAAYQAIEKSKAWADEARERARKVKERSSVDVPRGNQALRERIEDELLVKWGKAVIAGDSAVAAQVLDEADVASRDLVSAGGDTMARDEVALVRRAIAARRTDVVRAFAAAHILYGAARRHFLADRLQDASASMLEASRLFRLAGSPYEPWGHIYKAIALRLAGTPQAALEELPAARVARAPQSYAQLHGRYDWTEAVAFDALDRFDLGRDRLDRAVETFRRAGEIENLSATQTILAEAEWFLGERERAWWHQSAALRNFDLLRAGPRRNYLLLMGAYFALGADIPEAALHFQNALVQAVESARGPSRADEAYIQRARILSRLGNRAGALDDLRRAERAVAALEDQGLRDRSVADTRIARAEVLTPLDSRGALEDADAAFDYVRRADPAGRLAQVLMLRAASRESLGDTKGAGDDLQGAVSAFERKRGRLASVRDRMQAFEQERLAFKALVRLDTVVRGDDATGLRMAERGKAGVLLEKWSSPSGDVVDPGVAHSSLPADVAVVYCVTLRDRVLVWVLTREQRAHFSWEIPQPDLEALAARLQRLIRGGVTIADLTPPTREVFDRLVAPALERAPFKSVVVFVPDGPLFAVPFGAIPDRDGRPLIATRTVGVAPSLTSFLAASARLAGFVPLDVMAIGDGHDPRSSGLPRLALGDREAVEIGDLYPDRTVLVGQAATRQRLIREERSVLHFAGHTVVNAQFPLFSRLLLAPDPARADNGMLLASEMSAIHFTRMRVAVLATCDSATGRYVDGEGLISVAGMFFSAGVPAVVASLWPVADDSHELLVTFHRELKQRRDAPAALRAAQLALVERRGATLPVRLWGGFVALGGVTPEAR